MADYASRRSRSQVHHVPAHVVDIAAAGNVAHGVANSRACGERGCGLSPINVADLRRGGRGGCRVQDGSNPGCWRSGAECLAKIGSMVVVSVERAVLDVHASYRVLGITLQGGVTLNNLLT